MKVAMTAMALMIRVRFNMWVRARSRNTSHRSSVCETSSDADHLLVLAIVDRPPWNR